MVNLKEKPFFLDDEDIQWVEDTIKTMTLDEKVGQLFINLAYSKEKDYIKSRCDKYHIGGVRYQGGNARQVYEQNRYYQECTRIPLLIATNCEAGGNGAAAGGTLVATHAQCGACTSTQAAYDMGYVAGKEGTAVGCNWTFAPISDLIFNWRNTIVNTRSFGKDPDKVIAMCKAYMDGVHQSDMITCTKHFPGDGTEERDQHLVMGCNDLTCEEWDKTYGKVYKALIDAGIESVMVGHIALPAYQKKLNPALTDQTIMPATLSPELLQGLLREKLGFNGIILTDASHMAGMVCSAPRSVQVPGAIAAGCDMFLFFNDPDEDIQYVKNALEDGRLTQERLTEALRRILGMKAHLKLHKKAAQGNLFPSEEGLECFGCEAHHVLAKRAADEAVTLVKDTQNILPVSPETKKRARLYFIESAPVSVEDGTDPVKYIVKEELERVGFEVTLHENFYDMECKGHDPENGLKAMEHVSVEQFKKDNDIVFMFINMKGYAQESNVRVKWAHSHSNEMPWWVCEVPTVGVSLNYTNHMLDLPMLKTFINAYAPTRECIRAAIEKIVGRSEFKGHADDNVFCGRWDTRR